MNKPCKKSKKTKKSTPQLTKKNNSTTTTATTTATMKRKKSPQRRTNTRRSNEKKNKNKSTPKLRNRKQVNSRKLKGGATCLTTIPQLNTEGASQDWGMPVPGNFFDSLTLSANSGDANNQVLHGLFGSTLTDPSNLLSRYYPVQGNAQATVQQGGGNGSSKRMERKKF